MTSDSTTDDAVALVNALRMKGKIISTAESCTGGLLAGAITAVPGASSVFHAGDITYSNQAKIDRLGVYADVLTRFGAVSAQTAAAMAQGALKRNALAHLAISITGIAGPDGGSAQKPVGTVYIGLAYVDNDKNDEKTETHHAVFSGDRTAVRAQSVIHALRLALKLLQAF